MINKKTGEEIVKRAGMVFGVAKEYYSAEDGDWLIQENERLENAFSGEAKKILEMVEDDYQKMRTRCNGHWSLVLRSIGVRMMHLFNELHPEDKELKKIMDHYDWMGI